MQNNKVKPTIKEERRLWQRGFCFVCGIDEAGRGPLAGPVTAAAVVINSKFEYRNPKQYQKSKKFKQQKLKTSITDFSDVKKFLSSLGVDDSKKLTEKQREVVYERLTKSKLINFGVGIVSERVIDKINIKNAAEKAMYLAVKKFKRQPDFLLIDGNDLKNTELLKFNHKLIIKGDEKVFSIAAASVIAKVTRDRLMVKYDRRFPGYGFRVHKGYPSKFHLTRLKKLGPSKIHRRSFGPVREIIGKRLD
ncbi:MAG: ribonuclease HII [bacterium]